MNLILSSKAAKQLKRPVQPREDSSLDFNTWRVDCLALRKRSIFIISNEKTLYTYISSYKQDLGGILKKLATHYGQKMVDEKDIHYVKSKQGSFVSSMNKIKTTIRYLDQYGSNDNETYENLINQTPFKYLSDRSPAAVQAESRP